MVVRIALAQSSKDSCFDLTSRHAGDGSRGPALAQGSADVIAISHAFLVGVRRRHAVAGIVIEPAHQQGTGSSSWPRGLTMLRGKRLLHSVEQVTVTIAVCWARQISPRYLTSPM